MDLNSVLQSVYNTLRDRYFLLELATGGDLRAALCRQLKSGFAGPANRCEHRPVLLMGSYKLISACDAGAFHWRHYGVSAQS